MKEFTLLDWKVHLALSLHSPFQETRDKLMPFLSKWKIVELVDVCNLYSNKFKSKIMIEYIMIKGVTDRDSDLKELLSLGFAPMTNFNLIPLNGSIELDGKSYDSSSLDRCEEFSDSLRSAGFKCFIRKEAGTDIDAACGMLNEPLEK